MERNGAIIRANDLETIMVAADRLGVTRQRIHQMFEEGKLDYYRIGKRRLVHKRDIDKLVRAKARRRVA